MFEADENLKFTKSWICAFLICLLCLSACARKFTFSPDAITHESTVTSGNTRGGVSSVLVSTEGTNRTIVVFAATNSTTLPVISGAGLSWKEIASVTSLGTGSMSMYVAFAPSALTGATIDVSPTSDVWVDVYAHVASTAPVDQSSTMNGGVLSNLTITPTTPNTVVIGAIADWNDYVITVGTGYSAGTSYTDDTSFFSMLSFYGNSTVTPSTASPFAISFTSSSEVIGISANLNNGN